ncbi:MAG TPA: hypothetical protein VJU87_07120 [Gemmatimonadaceae bacterium]|nr:hypothetical protein [Gemmatimonadaceae bacterium]
MHATIAGWSGRLFLVFGTLLALPLRMHAQVVACDFDISDNEGVLVFGNTVHLNGRQGAGTNQGQFRISNADKPELDVDHDGYAPPPGCDYNNLYVEPVLSTNLINVDNPALAIPFANIIVTTLPRSLPTGTSAMVGISVDVPAGTVAGTYLGHITIQDHVRFATLGPNRETLGRDSIMVQVVVAEDRSLALVNSDTAGPLDSLVIAGRAGARAEGVLRVANTGNAPLPNVRASVSDLHSESAVGITIPASAIDVAPDQFASMAIADTARITVAVNIPRGILGGRYRGTLFVQGEGAAASQVPLILIVSSTRGIVFESNPVRNANGVARIAFNADPGTEYKVGIFDLNGLLVFTLTDSVFAGITAAGTPGTAQSPGAGADFAVNVIWPLINGRGEGVASGTYLVTAESIVNGARQLAQAKLIVIR